MRERPIMKHLALLWQRLDCGCHRNEHRGVWRWWARLIFPLMSAAALGWFLCRVIPKPIRATYPCQRAAFPLATAFIIWLIGIKSSLLAWLNWQERAQKLRSVLTACLAAFPLAGMAWAAVQAVTVLMGSAPAPKAVAWMPNDPPNSPVGQGKGIFPGRVTWVRDTNATPYSGASGYWWTEGTGVKLSVVEQMMSRNLRGLTGMGSDAGAWDRVFRYYNSTHQRGDIGYATNEFIAIKINLNNCTSITQTNNKADASQQVLLALLRQLVNQAGVPQSKIAVYEAAGSRRIPNRIYQPCAAEFPGVLWYDGVGDNGRQPITWVPNAFSYSGTTSCGRNLPACVTNATYLIDMPLLKGHEYAGVTLAAKNWYGSINARDHGAVLKVYSTNTPCYSMFVDMLGTRQLGGKTILYILDGLFGNITNTENNDPAHCAFTNLFGGQWTASMFMSLDPVALDSVGLDFLRCEFGSRLGYSATYQYGSVTNCDNYLHEAALCNSGGGSSSYSGTVYKPDGTNLTSLGVHEHWNNEVEKKYSRNLSPTGTGIELLPLHEAITVTLLSPANGTSLHCGSNVLLQATTSTNDSLIQRMDFFANSALIGSVSNAPWTMIWTNPPVNNWSIYATATDVLGDTYCSSSANLNIWPSDLRVSMMTPTNGAQFAQGANILLQATAVSTNTTVTQVDFFRNSAWLGTANNAPYSMTWSNAPACVAGLKAIATAGDGTLATSAVVTITIKPPGLAIAGTLYVDLRAPDFVSSLGIWTNHGTLGHFTNVGAPVLANNVLGTGTVGVQFNGTSDAFNGPNSVADIDGSGSRSFEAWVYNPVVANEETMLEIGHRGTAARNCAFNYGTNLTYGACAQWGSYDFGWGAASNIPPGGAWHHLVYTYDGTTNCCLYVDGALRLTKGLPGLLTTYAGEPILLGAQRGTTANSAPQLYFFSGYLNSVRVHGGVLGSNDVAANYAFGPAIPEGPANITGPPQDTAALEGGRATFTAQFTGAQPITCQWLRNGVPTLSATNSALTLTNLAWSDQGTAVQLVASNFAGGVPCLATSAVAHLTLVAPGDTLTHRWSFTSNANDSVGSAHGVLQGAAVLNNGQLVLNGTSNTYVSLPGNLIAVRNYAAVTFEAWASFGVNGNYARLFDQGSTNGANGQYDLYFCPHSGAGDFRLTIMDPNPSERRVMVPGNLDARTNLHIVCVLDPPSGFMAVYTNGVRAGSTNGLTSLTSVDTNWFFLGRSLFASDSWLNGSIDEFRIYNAALTAQQVARNFSNGPDNAPTPSLGAPPLALSSSGQSGQFRVAWPEWAAGVSLWGATNLSTGANWQLVSNSIVVTNGQTSFSSPTDTRKRFFRLRSP